MGELKKFLNQNIKVSLGLSPADRVLTQARIVDVISGRIRENEVVALAGPLIAHVGPLKPGLVGPETEVTDLAGAFLLPGLIDAHTHLDSLVQCGPFVEKALPFGQTAAVTETAMMAGALGPAGVELFLQDAAGLPMRMFFLTPALSPVFPGLETSAGFDQAAFDRMIARPDVLGVGEAYWPPVLAGDQRIIYRFCRARELYKTIEGHAAGARGDKLAAYRAAGVLSCHEATSLEEARERLKLGIAVMIREGYVRREMEAVLPGLTGQELDSGLVMLVSDTIDPAELVAGGGLNLLLRKAVRLGVDPVRAVRLMTLAPARHFNLRTLGAVLPGHLADLTAVRDLRDFECRQVWVDGRLVAENGRLTAPRPRFEYPEWTFRSLRQPLVRPEDLTLAASGERVRARVIALAGETITRLEEADLPVSGGRISADPDRDVLHLAHLNREGKAAPALGFVKGLGLKSGALASSLLWDNNQILAAGATAQDLAGAVNRLVEIGGGFVTYSQGRVLAELPLPVGGIISTLDLPGLVEKIAAVEAACQDLGSPMARPILTFQTLAFTGLPFVRLTDLGLVDVRRGEFLNVILK